MSSLLNTGNQLSNNEQVSSLSEIDSLPERQIKRQKTNMKSIFFEPDTLKKARRNTFSHWPYSQKSRDQMIEAGVFSCNKDDRVICIYCKLICHEWDIELNDPCEVHKALSPNCVFVKSMTCYHSPQYNNIVSTLPTYNDYVNPQNRLQSFSSWSNHKFPSIDKLVTAGFFYDGTKIICFYCNGSFNSCESNNDPLAEHVQRFPYCNYARQLCGETLYHGIQQSKRNKQGDSTIDKSKNTLPCDDNILRKRLAERLEWPISIRLLQSNKFNRSIIEQCWMNRLQFKLDDFVDGCELYMACDILQKQIEILNGDERKIIVPNIALRGISLPNNSNQSYSDILTTFENDHKTYENDRKTSARQFTEDETISIERETLLHNRPNIEPSRYALTQGGWFVYGSEDYTTQCPHCYIQYSKWKSDDNPLLIHRYLSPLCPFVLSLNPFNSNQILQRKVGEEYTNEIIAAAESQPYIGLVQNRNNSNSVIANRKTSFGALPNNSRLDTDALATDGFSYDHRQRSIKCFYCTRAIFIWNHIPQSSYYFKQLHSPSRCRYVQQLNDHDPIVSNEQNSTNKCKWCLNEDKCLVALPCRHCCLCQTCGKIKRLCLICNIKVTRYVTVYVS